LHQPNVSEQDEENRAVSSLSATGFHQDQNFDKDNQISDEDDPDESDPSPDKDDPCLDKNLKISPKNVSIINVMCFEFSWNPKEDLLAIDFQNEVRIWNTKRNEWEKKFQIEEYDSVKKLQWSNDGSLLAIGTNKGVVHIWNIKEDKEDMKFEIEGQIEGQIYKIKWNPDGRYIYASSYENSCVRDLISNENVFETTKFLNCRINSFVWQTNEVFALSYQHFSLERRNFFVASCKINENTAQQIKLINREFTYEENFSKFNSNGRFLARMNPNRRINIINILKLDPNPADFFYEIQIEGEPRKFFWLSRGLETKETILATINCDFSVKFWNVESRNCIKTIKLEEWSFPITISNDGKLIACTDSTKKNLSIWCTESNNIVKTFQSDRDIWKIKWNGSGNKVALECVKQIKILNLDDLQIQNKGFPNIDSEVNSSSKLSQIPSSTQTNLTSSSSIGPDSQNTTEQATDISRQNMAVSLLLQNQDVDEIQPTQGQQQPIADFIVEAILPTATVEQQQPSTGES